MSTTKVTIALVTGLAAGAALGLLFAPQTGTETRDKLSASLAELGDCIKETAATQIDDLVDTFKTRVVDVIKSKLSGPAQDADDDLEHA